MNKYFYSSVLDDANDYRYTVLNIKKFKCRKCYVPYIVNSSFALELYLKSILIAEKIYYKNEHCLTRLFELIPDSIKNELILKCKDLNVLLRKYDNAFIEFRYHYELFDTKTGKEKSKMMLNFNSDEIETLLLLFHDYCNNKYLNVDFVQMQMNINKDVK